MPRRETRRLWGANGSQMRPQSFVSCVPHLPAHSPVHRYFNEWPMAHHLRLGLHTPSKRRRSLLQIDDNGASGYHHFLGVTVPQIPEPSKLCRFDTIRIPASCGWKCSTRMLSSASERRFQPSLRPANAGNLRSCTSKLPRHRMHHSHITVWPTVSRAARVSSVPSDCALSAQPSVTVFVSPPGGIGRAGSRPRRTLRCAPKARTQASLLPSALS